MNILSDTTQLTENSGLAIVFLIAVGLAALSAGIWLLYVTIKEKEISLIILVVFLFFIVALCAFGIIRLANSYEHIIKVTLDEGFSANELLENYKVKDIDGKIYTLVVLDK